MRPHRNHIRTMGNHRRWRIWSSTPTTGKLATPNTGGKVGLILWLGIDQYARIEQAKRIQGRLSRLEGSGKQWWALAIVPRPMVAPDRVG